MDLSRRDALGMGAGMLLTSSFPADTAAASAAKIQLPVLPEYVLKEIRLARSRFVEWKGDDETLVFPVVSDVHSGTVSLTAAPDWKDGIWHQLFLDEAAAAFGADFVANLGDIGIDRNRTDWKDEPESFGRSVLAAEKRIYDAFRVPSLHVVGNHDLGNARWHISSMEYFDYFNSPLRARREFHVEGEAWGYWDFRRKMTRVVFLNTSELNVGNTKGKLWVGMTGRQAEFLDRTLSATPKGWTVVVLTHASLHPWIGLWSRETNPRNAPGLSETLEVLKRHAGEGRIRLAGVFSGHSHLDADLKENGVQHVLTQSYGLNGPDRLRPMYRYNRINLASSFLIDIVAVKPYRSRTKVFRLGAGGPECDREFPCRSAGAKAFSFAGGEAHIVSSSYPRPLSFSLSPEDFERGEKQRSWVKDGVRFVWIDNSAHDVTDGQNAFFRAEAAKGEGVVLLLKRPFFMPGRPESDAPCAHPESRPKQNWSTFAFRESVFLYTPNVLGVFAPACGRPFWGADNGRYQVALEKGAKVTVYIN
jgi:hypothetical protein